MRRGKEVRKDQDRVDAQVVGCNNCYFDILFSLWLLLLLYCPGSWLDVDTFMSFVVVVVVVVLLTR